MSEILNDFFGPATHEKNTHKDEADANKTNCSAGLSHLSQLGHNLRDSEKHGDAHGDKGHSPNQLHTTFRWRCLVHCETQTIVWNSSTYLKTKRCVNPYLMNLLTSTATYTLYPRSPPLPGEVLARGCPSGQNDIRTHTITIRTLIVSTQHRESLIFGSILR